MNIMSFVLFLITLFQISQPLLSQENMLYSHEGFASWFNEKVNQGNTIYRGKTYPLKLKARYGHQFYKSQQWTTGSIKMNNSWYYNLSLLFDLIEQELIIKPQTHTDHGIIIKNSDIQEFKLNGDEFISLLYMDKIRFHQVLYKGKEITLTAYHQKSLDLKADGYHVQNNTDYYIIYEEDVILLRRKKSLDKITSNWKSIRKSIKDSNAKFNLRKPQLLIEFVTRFDNALEYQ